MGGEEEAEEAEEEEEEEGGEGDGFWAEYIRDGGFVRLLGLEW